MKNPDKPSPREQVPYQVWQAFEEWLKHMDSVLKDSEDKHEEAVKAAEAGDNRKFGECLGIAWKRVTQAREDIAWALTHQFNPPSNN